jgi:hypothetical protein
MQRRALMRKRFSDNRIRGTFGQGAHDSLRSSRRDCWA